MSRKHWGLTAIFILLNYACLALLLNWVFGQPGVVKPNTTPTPLPTLVLTHASPLPPMTLSPTATPTSTTTPTAQATGAPTNTPIPPTPSKTPLPAFTSTPIPTSTPLPGDLGYTVSDVRYTLNRENPSLLDQIAFVIVPTAGAAPPARVHVQVINGGGWYSCAVAASPAATVCDLSRGNVRVADMNTLTVSAVH